MAQKKSISKAKKASTASKRNTSQNNKSKQVATKKRDVPVRLIVSLSALALFVLFLVILLNSEGAVTKLFYDGILAIFGHVAYYVSIPALLYLFFIQAFSGKRPVLMRSICLGSFVVICGMFQEMVVLTGTDVKHIASFGELWNGGISGLHAGVLCGGLGSVLRWAMGPVLPYIILVIAGILTLLATMQITVPGIVRAIKNRPRAEWEEEDEEDAEEVVEPAAIVVNHIANKRIEMIEKRREQELIQEEAQKQKAGKKADDLMRQIDMDVEAPVSAAEKHVTEQVDDSIFTPVGGPVESVVIEDDSIFTPLEAPVRKRTLTENIPQQMPALDMEDVAADIGAAVEQMQQEELQQTPEVPVKPEPVAPAIQPQPAKVTAKEAAESAALVAAEIEEHQLQEKPVYCFPPIDLLKKPTGAATDGTAEMRENTRRLNETLESFKIDGRIINVTRGPSVTRYEVELDKGVRLNKLTGAADDIALSLGASGVRIAAVPGKISIVGIEVPNRAVTTVSLREVIDSPEFDKAKSKSAFAVGKDIGGNCIVGNIAKLPHMLIAGTTGSGKSVCMNSIIISLLYKASPEDVKLIMIDPKMVELGIYNAIPHLLIPVVTDPKKAAGSLQWAVTEMMRRYKSMSDVGVRDLESYNAIMEAEEGQKIPQVVVIIDELADLMIVAAKEVEESICRIAQMGRAAGIHLIIATQRPSADVITGLMKANIPSRIAFAVASAMESRIILDTMGAEKLVGKGDMLFSPIGSGKPQRVQGCFVSDSEVEAVATYVKDNFNVTYDKGIMEEIDKKAAQTGKSTPISASDPEPNDAEMDGDEMLPAAVDVILETGQASVSMLQRRLKLGYARAARIVDEMEEKGIVGPFQGSKPRAILITKEQWEVMKGIPNAQLGFEDLADEEFAPVPEEID